ncbi:Uncharacterised protein [Mycobacteroides abscessus subsp. abscessus]|nr:Uncharacterised protein [Mycobacteroides abscessus subsp. abscessus]
MPATRSASNAQLPAARAPASSTVSHQLTICDSGTTRSTTGSTPVACGPSDSGGMMRQKPSGSSSWWASGRSPAVYGAASGSMSRTSAIGPRSTSGPMRVSTFMSGRAAGATSDQKIILVKKSRSGVPRSPSVSIQVTSSTSVTTKWSSMRPLMSRDSDSALSRSARWLTCWLLMLCSQARRSEPGTSMTARSERSMMTAPRTAARCSPRGSP